MEHTVSTLWFILNTAVLLLTAVFQRHGTRNEIHFRKFYMKCYYNGKRGNILLENIITKSLSKYIRFIALVILISYNISSERI